ncbi:MULTISPECIES: ABC transporter ATP-binding protein [unclassified Motilimonas]|uniref:energy-coupling factor ABC transporter ATP-binding protein n=1 Tax=unclassified Motilimonas TaxID=2643697 RepID=UPI001E37D3AF|nr:MULTISPECIES: ABC transporter ATP-binding protein [unclassified Motilimonas]MCE0557432.1 energy-coupling factor ABC transporter ATP-binding protein [Motilimonas sp. E26]MDO6526886.1 ABC transporter ATP-binding protein [Motilimonas sp. 1_MG-2023]
MEINNVPLLALDKVSFAYPRRPAVLDQVNFSLYQGERVALMGDNGAGKTTLLHLLVGLKKPLVGQVIAFGTARDSEKSFVDVRAQAGFLFQDPDDQLFCPTVLEDVMFGPLNLGFSRIEAKLRAEQVLHQLGLEHFACRITHQLSGGEKRMISLASVLAMTPKVLLLDEPTNALDTAARQRLIDTLKGLPQAMLIVSHDHDFLAQISTRSVVLTSGKLSDSDYKSATELTEKTEKVA